ncbi:MAG: DUF167 domain-containing protein [Oceanococcus sp.]
MNSSKIQKCIVKLKVSPKASRNAIAAWHGDALKLSVTAVPEKGRANDAVLELLASQLGLAKTRCRIVRGHNGRDKTVELDINLKTFKYRVQQILDKS